MPAFFTVKEAARRSGKSPSSVRRIIYPIIENDQHADRQHILPSIPEVVELRTKGENFAWRISEELLLREMPPEAPREHEVGTRLGQAARGAEGELLAMLRSELDIKNRQITQQTEMISKQMELINGLSERLREGNILIGSLQRQLALPDGSQSRKSSPAEAEIAHTGEGESAPKKTPKPPKPKRGFFRHFFR